MNKKNNKNKSEGYISNKEATLYGLGEFYGTGSVTIVSVLMLFFFNQAIGIQVEHVGAIIMVAKIWDAISDPFMGVISDNTRSKLGRRRPYIMLGGVMSMLALMWLFAPIQGVKPYWLKVVIATFGYLFFSTSNTVSQVPYCSLSSDISPDFRQRNKANTFKLMFSLLAAAVCFLIPSLVSDKIKNRTITNNQIFLIFGLGFGLLFAVVLIVSALFTKERTSFDPNLKSKFTFRSYVRPFKIKSYKWHLAMYITAFLCMDIMAAIVPYYSLAILKGMSINIFGKSISIGTTMVIGPMMVTAGIFMPVSLLIAKHKSKQLAFRIGLPLYILGGILLSIYPQSWRQYGWLPILIASFMGIGLAGAQSMPWMIFPDTIDVAELKLKTRPTGEFSGLMTFSRKLVQAFAIFLLTLVLQHAGMPSNSLDKEAFAVPDKAKIAIKVLVGVVITTFITLAFISSLNYKITSKRLERVKYFIDKNNEGEDDEVLTLEEKKEKKELMNLLVYSKREIKKIGKESDSK